MDYLGISVISRIKPQNAKAKERTYNKSGTKVYKTQEQRDNTINNIKSALNPYNVSPEQGTLAASVAGMDGIKFMNPDYVAASLYIHRTYSDNFLDPERNVDNISKKMFKDGTPAMKNIKKILNRKSKSKTKDGDLWPKRKRTVLGILVAIINYYDNERGDEDEENENKIQSEEEEEEEEAEEQESNDFVRANRDSEDPGSD